ncbi:hypothetical protein SHIRM173S_09500 [Streptomyces hirsutus]
MAKDLDITYQDMREAAKHVVKEKEKLQEKLDGLRKYINNLVNSGYVTQSLLQGLRRATSTSSPTARRPRSTASTAWATT